jgi:DNA-binding CsgD family transcriptional regulator
VLTGRELEVLELVAEGLVNDEIARRLGLGRPTVVRLIRSAQQKLGAGNRAQAAALAIRQ